MSPPTTIRALVSLGWALAVGASAQHRHEATVSPAPLLEGIGGVHHPVDTRSEAAQRYFDQGLRFYYAFNHDEALRSFQEASRRDPDCAMAYWGMALSLGSDLNNPVIAPEQERSAYRRIQQAVQRKSTAGPSGQAFIEALALRYSSSPGTNREALDRAYMEAMRSLSERFPDDLDAATLYAESLLLLRPWDQWSPDGTPQSGTMEAIAALERALRKDSTHTGANHFLIHALEASPHPERALPAAERLPKLAPAAGHLVHMPSHIYLRLGRYANAAAASRRAEEVDLAYIQKHPDPKSAYQTMYYPHNIFFTWAALLMDGRSREAMDAARRLAKQVTPEKVLQHPMLEDLLPLSVLTMARFGQWEEILRQPRPPLEFPYWVAHWHYARGLALVSTGRSEQAEAESRVVTAVAEGMSQRIPPEGNSPTARLRLTAEVLKGEIAARRGDLKEAIGHLRDAVSLQDRLPYTEPPAWFYPVRQSLGAVLLEAGELAQAEAVYREDLRRNPENGWSLLGLAQVLRRQKKLTESAAVQARFRAAWSRADVKPASSRF